MNICDVLREAVRQGASDIHILAKLPPVLRINGKLVVSSLPALSAEECRDLVYPLLTPAQIRAFEETRELDFSWGLEGCGRFRMNLHYQRGSPGLSVRLIKDRVPSFDELGLPGMTIRDMLGQPYGLVLVCGPTGSGKSTTLAAMVEYIGRTFPVHIITIEDPIEYLFRHGKAVVEQREIGEDTRSFSESLKRVLRQDPDVVLIGEMRDLETIEAALRIAETGHLVLATLHTGDVVQAMGRIVNSFSDDRQDLVRIQLSLVLLGVIVQQLIPRSDGGGRVLATELMVATGAVRNLIREGQFNQIYSLIQLGGNIGMHTMNSSLANLVAKGSITRDMALARSGNSKELSNLLRPRS